MVEIIGFKVKQRSTESKLMKKIFYIYKITIKRMPFNVVLALFFFYLLRTNACVIEQLFFGMCVNHRAHTQAAVSFE